MTLIGTPLGSLEVDPIGPSSLPRARPRAQREKRGTPPQHDHFARNAQLGPSKVSNQGPFQRLALTG